jgi:hypothetical protein
MVPCFANYVINTCMNYLFHCYYQECTGRYLLSYKGRLQACKHGLHFDLDYVYWTYDWAILNTVLFSDVA